MKTGMKLSGLALMTMLFYGCATEPSKLSSVTEARTAYQQISQDDQVAQYAPEKLSEAKQQLDEMNDAVENDADKEEIDHLAYLVQQRVEIAKTATQQQIAANQLESLNKERAQVQMELAEVQREQERAEQAALEAEQAKAMESSLLQQFSQIKSANANETQRGIVLTMEDLHFDFGKSALKSEAVKNLNDLTQFLKQNPEHNVVVEGYTDSFGPSAFNLQLSRERAQAVIDYLSSQGINQDRLIARGYGESFPVASNENPAGRRFNRRVEFVVLRSGESPEMAFRQPSTEEFASFSELDQDNNGYLSKDETQQIENLSGNFNQFDKDQDQNISRSEFSAFEEMEIEQYGEQYGHQQQTQ